MNRDALYAELARDEGKRLKMYLDSVGVETIGIGHNLRDRPISEAAVRQIFEDDVALAEIDARILFPAFDGMTDVRQRVLVNMSFNMGITRLAQFRRFLAALDRGDYNLASVEMKDSRWAVQVGARAERLAKMMREG